MKIRLLGQKNDSGIGSHYGGFTDALSRVSGINALVEFIDHTDYDAVNAAVKVSQSNDINISFVCVLTSTDSLRAITLTGAYLSLLAFPILYSKLCGYMTCGYPLSGGVRLP